MDLQAAETASQREQVVAPKKSWHCPCNGCAKAVKQERARILEELDKIDLDAPYQINAVGLKILVKEIIGSEDKKVKKK